MPEGDTVFLAATRMHTALAGQRLVATDFRVPRFATADLSGQVVREVAARGKHLLLRTDAGTTLHTHFKMEGTWHLYRPRERWRGPDFQVRAVLRTDPWVAVGFRLAICELLPTAERARGRRPPRPRRPRPRLGPGRGPPPPPRRPRPGHRHRPARPARHRRARQRLQVRGLLPPRRRPLDPGRRGRGPGGHGRPPQAPDGGQPHHRQPDHHRRHPPRPHPLGRRPAPASPAAAAAPPSARPTSPATTANGSPTGAPPASRAWDRVGSRRCRLFVDRVCHWGVDDGVDDGSGERAHP